MNNLKANKIFFSKSIILMFLPLQKLLIDLSDEKISSSNQ